MTLRLLSDIPLEVLDGVAAAECPPPPRPEPVVVLGRSLAGIRRILFPYRVCHSSVAKATLEGNSSEFFVREYCLSLFDYGAGKFGKDSFYIPAFTGRKAAYSVSPAAEAAEVVTALGGRYGGIRPVGRMPPMKKAFLSRWWYACSIRRIEQAYMEATGVG